MKKVFDSFIGFLTCLLLTLLLSCEIGLGSQVDVDPPSVTLDSPSENARTRKAITFNGTWKDDLAMKNITVSLKKTNNEEEYGPFKASVISEKEGTTSGTWSCTVDPIISKIPDGAYSVSVTAVDTYKHATVISTFITIDNTAPFLVLDSPSTTSIETPMAYGQSFSLIGRGADEVNGGTIDSIDAIIYSSQKDNDDFTEIARKTFTGVSTSIDFEVAQWEDEIENFYTQIYGSDKEAGTKTYYLGLEVFDDARQVPAVEGDRGNSTSTIYLSNDLSLISGYKPSVAYNILNGSLSADNNPELAEVLNSKKVDKLTFSLNPVNNPYFQLQGYESLGDNPDLEVESYGLMNKNSLTVNIYVGRDKNAILPQTIGIYLIPCDKNGTIIPDMQKITLLEPGTLTQEGGVTQDAKLTNKFELFSSSCTWVSNSLNVDDIEGLSIGKYYLVEVEATDVTGVGIRNDNKFGIKITSSNTPPILTVKKPGSSIQIASSDEFSITGSVKTATHLKNIRLYKKSYNENELDENYLGVEIVVKDGFVNNDSEIEKIKNGIYLNSLETTSALRFYNFECTAPKVDEESYTILVVATDDINQNSSKEISVDNDMYLPEFDSQPTISPLVYTSDGEYKVNGIVEISELITDNKKVAYSWYSDEENFPTDEEQWKIGNVKGSTSGNLKFTVDTTQFADKSQKKIYLKAQDSSGNIAYNGKENDSVIILNIDQSTDAPIVKLQNTDDSFVYDSSWTVEDYQKVVSNPKRTIFGTSANNEILGSISDDDGIESVKVFYQSIEIKDEKLLIGEKNQIPLELKPEGKTTYNLKAKAPSDENTYLITIEVKDTKQESTGFNSTILGPFMIAVDNGSPKIQIQTASEAFKSGIFSVNGICDDVNATITRYDDEACTVNGKLVAINQDGIWEDKIDCTNSQKIYYYQAKDIYGQVSKEKFTYKYDSKSPSYKINKINGDDLDKGFEKFGTLGGSYFLITGEVSDAYDDNNLAIYDTESESYANLDANQTAGFVDTDFYYYVGNKIEQNGLSYDITNWHSCKISPSDVNAYIGKFTVTLNFKELNCKEGGIYYIYFAAKDSAGNISLIQKNEPYVKVTIDSLPPQITSISVSKLEKNPEFQVVAKDTVSLDTKIIEVYNNNNLLDSSEYTLSCKALEEESEFSFTLKTIPANENKYKVTVFDKAGNKSQSSEIVIVNQAPVISSKETGISAGAYKTEKEGKSYEYITGAIVASATVSCSGMNNKLESVTWKDEYKKDETATEGAAESLSSGSCMPDGSGKITIEAVGDEKLADYENKYVTRTVTATNIFGQSTEWSYNFILDKTAPQINASEIKLGDVEYSQIAEKWYKTDTLKLSGTVTEAGSGVNKIDYELNKGGNLGNLRGTIYTTDSGNKETFESIISGFDEETEGSSANSLKLTVSDKAGNKANVLPMPKINIDMTAPKLTETVAPQEQNSGTSAVWYRFVEENGEASGNSGWKKYNNSILTNKTKVIELAGGFEDKNGDRRQSGVSEICVKIGEKQIPAKVYSKNEEGKWEIPADDKTGFEKETDGSGPKGGVWIAKIEAENLTEGDSTKSAVISIKDYAGNAGSTVSVNFLVDTEAPETLIEMPSAEAKLNGKVTFSGKVNDSNDVKSIQIYYAFAKNEIPLKFDSFNEFKYDVTNSNSQKLIKDTENGYAMSDITGWKFTEIQINSIIEEYNKNNQTEETSLELYILPVAYDVAGNCSVSGTAKLTADTVVQENQLTKVQIDLNSDRPIVKINNLSGSGENCYVTSNNLNISVEDDDGIKEVKFTFDKPGDWESAQTVTLSSGSGTIPLGADGTKSLYLKITDTQGGEFTTGVNKIYQPYIKYSDSNDEMSDNSSAIKFHKDTAVPDFDAFYFGIGEDKESDFSRERKELKSSSKAGGKRGKFVVFEVEANDGGTNGSGISSVKVDYSTTSENTGTDSLTLVDGTTGLYRSEAFEVGGENGWTQGNHTLTFTVQDKAGHTNTSTKQIIIDNGAPAATLITPSNDEKDVQIGIITLSGTANDEYSAVTDVRYLVLNDNYYDGENGKGTLKSNVSDLVRTEITKEGYKCFNSGSNNTWKFTLDGLVQVGEKKNPLLPYDETTLKDYSKVPRDEKDILTMRVYIYAKDDLGNESVTGFDFKYNPYGDRPQADVTFPIGIEGSEANVNGSIRITGSAQDNVSVKEVFVQIDMNKDGKFTEADKDLLSELKDNENQIYQIITDTEYKTGDAIKADLSAIGDEGFWGIKANGTNSWNLTVNQYGEMMAESNKIDGKEGQYKINIRAVAVDNNYKFGNWSDTQFVIIDNNIPTIGKQAKNIKEYDDKNDVTATKTYVTDMYVKGKANLEISVEDINGIKQVMYYIATTEEGLATAAGEKCDLSGVEQTFTGGTKGYILEIPLTEDNNSSGTKFVKVVAMKNSDTETTAYEKFCVNFDNSAPQINDITLNGVKHSDSDKKIVNSNGTYFTLGGSVKDDGGSGFDKVLFYYYRKGETQNRIYDVMIDSTDSSNKDAGRINIDESLIKSRNLGGQVVYGTEQSVTINSDKRTFNIEKNKHIRAGGVVEINGTWLTIEKIENDGTIVTLKSDAPVIGNQMPENHTVFFAYAQVIDNTGSEKTDAEGNITSGDDGDGMAESIIKSLNTWTYDATFHSNYIPDGPGKLVVIAFDKAGNVTGTSYEASVQNNAPRLTRVMLATDLNGNGKYEYYSDSTGPVNDMSEGATANGTEFGEFAFYSTLNNKGEGSNIATVTLPAGRDPFVAKNNLLVVPEFTGGNGELSYTYKIVDDLANAGIKTVSAGEATEKFAAASKIVNKEGTNVKFDSSQSKEFEITNGVLEGYESWTSDEKLTKYLAATFWDSTEETTPGVDSCYALLKMPLIINVKDDTKPTATITPFYWNSKEDSSFVYDENGNPLGHIDLPAEGSNDNPGVSGQVYIEGTAWDDTRLGSIWIKGPGDKDDFVELATFTNGKWNCEQDFEIFEDYGITQSGHTVKWRYKMDMTPYGIGTNKVVTVKAEDAMTEPNVSDITTQDSKYTMDFVPYIKSIYAKDVGSANRSRLGKFPVRAGEDMIIEGMNFAKDASYEVKFYKSGDSGLQEVTTEAMTGKITTNGKITVTAPQYSRWVEVVVNDVATKNNTNVNGGYNIEAGYVAKDNDLGAAKAASAGTNFWTDDRYISVWTNTALEGSINPWDGTVKQIRNRDTRDGSFYKNSSGNSVDLQNNTKDTYYAGWSSPNMMIYSTLGNGAATNVRTLYNNSQASFVTPVETVDIAIIGGLPWYVFNDNYVGGNSANTWGAGLMIAREGYNFPKNALNGTNTISDSENLNIVERQGNSTPAESRNSANGYDSVLHQFKNPKITGWYDGTSVQMNDGNGEKEYSGTVYVYVSYYDSYARCLKYAAFTEGWSNNGVGEKWGNINGTKNFKTLARAANNHKEPTTVVAGVDRIYNNPTDFSVNNGEDCGEWSDIMVDPSTHVPVIIYYNKTKGNLEVAQGKSAAPSTTNYKASAGSFADTTEGDDGWSKTKSITPKNGIDFGRYVSAEIDSQGNIHASAMDTTNGKLYYIFLDKDEGGTSYTPSYHLVDSTSAVGMWTDIQLGTYEAETNVWSDYAPVIAYLDKGKLNTTSAAKIAYVESGKWEAINDPAVYEAYDKKTNAMCNVYESTTEGVKAKAAISFNSSMLVLDFLRGED